MNAAISPSRACWRGNARVACSMRRHESLTAIRASWRLKVQQWKFSEREMEIGLAACQAEARGPSRAREGGSGGAGAAGVCACMRARPWEECVFVCLRVCVHARASSSVSWLDGSRTRKAALPQRIVHLRDAAPSVRCKVPPQSLAVCVVALPSPRAAILPAAARARAHTHTHTRTHTHIHTHTYQAQLDPLHSLSSSRSTLLQPSWLTHPTGAVRASICLNPWTKSWILATGSESLGRIGAGCSTGGGHAACPLSHSPEPLAVPSGGACQRRRTPNYAANQTSTCSGKQKGRYLSLRRPSPISPNPPPPQTSVAG
jgi:hypothetical protein